MIQAAVCTTIGIAISAALFLDPDSAFSMLAGAWTVTGNYYLIFQMKGES